MSIEAVSSKIHAGLGCTKQSGARRRSPAAEWTFIALVAVLLLVPCFWQPHIIAGDLSSHLYNAWLAGQIEQGKVPGQRLSVVHPVTNILADWVLEGLLYKVGPVWAERIVVAAAVESFFWGAFFFVAAAAGGKRCWIVAPSLAMVTYGLIFHLGFLNFYISTGFSFWLLAILWRPRQPWLWLAIPCAALALLAHPLPLGEASAALLYVHGLRWVPERYRWMFFTGAAILLIAAQTALLSILRTPLSVDYLVGLEGILGLAGAGQLWLYGAKYLIVIAGILIVWSALFLERLDRGAFLKDPLVHIWGLSLLAYILMPSLIQFPGYSYPLEFMHFRISLFIAILFCAMVSGGQEGRKWGYASCVVSVAFFSMVYLDARSLNQVEAELNRLVSSVPQGSRVVFAMGDSASPRLNGLIHIGSTTCIGHCWDYGNYEAATGQFRIHVSGPNGVVADNMHEVGEIENGLHVVTAQEAPLYNLCPPKSGNSPFELRRLSVGEKASMVFLPATDHFGSLPIGPGR